MYCTRQLSNSSYTDIQMFIDPASSAFYKRLVQMMFTFNLMYSILTISVYMALPIAFINSTCTF